MPVHVNVLTPLLTGATHEMTCAGLHHEFKDAGSDALVLAGKDISILRTVFQTTRLFLTEISENTGQDTYVEPITSPEPGKTCAYTLNSKKLKKSAEIWGLKRVLRFRLVLSSPDCRTWHSCVTVPLWLQGPAV